MKQKLCQDKNCEMAEVLQPIDEFKRPGAGGLMRTFGVCNKCHARDKAELERRIDRLNDDRSVERPEQRRVWQVIYRCY